MRTLDIALLKAVNAAILEDILVRGVLDDDTLAFHKLATFVIETDKARQRARKRYQLRREHLHSVQHSAWRKLRWCIFKDKSDDAAFRMCGMSAAAFIYLTELVGSACPERVPGRKRGPGNTYLLDHIDITGLALRYLTSTVDTTGLILEFNVTATQIIYGIRDGLKAINLALANHELASIHLPNVETAAKWAAMIADPSTSGLAVPAGMDVKCIGWLDGFVTAMRRPGKNYYRQRSYYNGKHRIIGVNSNVGFAPTGIIWYASLNNPGSWHDYECAVPLCRAMKVFLPGFGVLADVAYRSAESKGAFVTIGQSYDALPSDLRSLLALRELERWITKKRQAVEWGIHGFKQEFKRLDLKLTENDELRGDLLLACARLHNFKLRFGGHRSQIRTVYYEATKLAVQMVAEDEERLEDLTADPLAALAEAADGADE